MDSYRSIIVLCFMISVLKLISASTKPNIILIVADDLGYNDVSFHGSDQIPTPNIDFLAYNGILLNNYYVSPICTPTRAALMTGRHPIHTGMQHSVIVGDQPYGLALNETLMSQHLNKLGYRSHIVGKWHLGMMSWEYTPLYRGFESHLGYYQGSEDYYNHTYEATKSQVGLDFRKDKSLYHTSNYSTYLFRDEAVKIINNHNKSEPLFLYLPFQAVHSGNGIGTHLQAPVEYINKFKYIQNKQRRIYAAMMSVLDDAVGSVYDTLKTTGLLSNSIIVFMTDNGGAANGFDFNAANNFPLRGVKATLWEGGVKAVGLVHSPLLKKQGYVANQMLHVCDWLPTLYSAAGGNVSELKNLDGYDAWDMLNTNGTNVRDEILHNIDPREKKFAIRVGEYKLLKGSDAYNWNGWYPQWKLHGDEEFLHYTNDIDEFTESESKSDYRQKLDTVYRKFWPQEVKDRIKTLYKGRQMMNGKGRGTPVVTECGPKPLNASTNCNRKLSVCLFKITEDPCEYNNIAEQHPDIVRKMLLKLEKWESTMVAPRNLPFDDRGNPKHHGGAWVPWL